MTAARIGALRHRVTLEQPLRTPDGGGGAAVAWEAVAELWAAIRPIGGDERLEADQVAGRITHTIWIRRRSGVDPSMRFRQGTRLFDIRAVLDTEDRTRLRCLCEERHL